MLNFGLFELSDSLNRFHGNNAEWTALLNVHTISYEMYGWYDIHTTLPPLRPVAMRERSIIITLL